uniref:Uncharacterized protein n=1 Tax=Caenorhabditis japonica TaxID=281687 RepID=A0A8R1HRB8_CAEJA
MQNATELVELCRKIRDDEPVLFPRFLCALLYVYQEENKPALPHTRELFTEYSEAILFLNDPLNYPCHSFFGKLDVVAFAPSRIFSGCIDDLDPKNNSTLSHAFVMTHPFPEMKMCTEIGKRARCELRSMMVQDAMLFQEEDCCCDSGDCVILVFTQVKSLTPIIIKRVDLRAESLIPLRKETTPIVSINMKTTATTKPRKTP